MTATGVRRQEPASSAGRSWNLALLTTFEVGRRNRRTIDSVFLLWAAIVIGLSAVIASSAPEHDQDVAEALTTVLGWAGALWRTAFVGLLVLALVIVVDVLVRRRWDLARDLLVAALVLMAAGILLGRAVESDWLPAEGHLLSRWGYPELRLATATAVVVVVAPELVRWARVLASWLVPLAMLARWCSGPRGRPRRSARWRSVSARAPSSVLFSARRRACPRASRCARRSRR